ncbi:putative disease resistance protein At1g50180 [Manihot esculenta]|uniref:Uncharacterized protein n=1 Tax=Manihot esculenta TaxID=3983 RepID=A0A2C9V9Q5_MANES|nr:putative disease resistance protein At1g50180 [Manihot esculenta]OAY40597.1 hypothetical protein MANES_09G034700v8 [Manihot esculenta]
MAEAVVSFVVQKLGDLLIEEVTSLYDVQYQVESIERELTRMQCFLKDADAKQKGDMRVNNWVRDIRDVAFDVEDIIDTFVLKLACQRRRSGLMGFTAKFKYCFRDLAARRQLAEDIRSIKRRICEISTGRVTYGIENIGGDNAPYVCEKMRERRRSSPHVDNHDVIGFDEDINMLVLRLVDLRLLRRRVISIVGMGGLGKTTLAKKVYNCTEVKRHFDLCAWVYVSQDYRAREILHEIGRRVLSISKDNLAAMNKDDLEEKLYRVLSKKRYLIVLDDIWKIEVWDDLKAIFPDVMNGSKLLFTTRIKEVAMHADPSSPLHELHFLSAAKSWQLFTKKAFPMLVETGSFACPPELERLGKQIVAKCGGLPLAIVILGGLLSRKEKTTCVWSRVLQSVNWQLTHDPNKLLEILALSYNDLPYYLKPCFLYFGLFPEDLEIPAPKLMLFWIAEGFVQQRGEEAMEDVAEDFLEELIDRSMVQVVERRYDGKIKACRIHDLLRDLAISEAKECKFLEILDGYTCDSMIRARRIAIHTTLDMYLHLRHSNLHLRSLLRFTTSDEYLQSHQWTHFGDCHKLLRVLDLQGAIVSILPKATGELIHLRHLGLKNTGLKRFSFPINNLSKLQTLDIRATKLSRMPKELWKMQSLRRLYFHRIAITGRFPDHVSATNLRTLSTVSIYGNNWVPNFLGKLTNLRKLGIEGYHVSQTEALSNALVKLSSLEILQLKGADPISDPVLRLIFKLPNIYKLHLSGAMDKLPDPGEIQPNLTKLCLEMSQLEHDSFVTMERLPNLKMLRLLSNSFCEKEMVCSSGGFPKLHCLEIRELEKLEEWRIDVGAMPGLRRLIIHDCENLKMIPEGLQYITTLKEVVIEGMADEFEARIQQDCGSDWHKVQHIPSIVIRIVLICEMLGIYFCWKTRSPMLPRPFLQSSRR